MLHSYEFCSERADEALAAADAAKLDNVRNRELRSEKTWRGLAELARSTAEGRIKADRERAERREEEAATQQAAADLAEAEKQAAEQAAELADPEAIGASTQS
ncbi:MAG: hypothetical protein ACXIT4_05660 [Erythrobacter sp.]